MKSNVWFVMYFRHVKCNIDIADDEIHDCFTSTMFQFYKITKS